MGDLLNFLVLLMFQIDAMRMIWDLYPKDGKKEFILTDEYSSLIIIRVLHRYNIFRTKACRHLIGVLTSVNVLSINVELSLTVGRSENI